MSFIDFQKQLSVDSLVASISIRNAESNLDRFQLAGNLKIPSDQMCIPGQVHSADVQFAPESGTYSEVDGLVTNKRGLFLSLQVADCIPLFLIDPVSGALGLIHAGWRGTAGGIVPNALNMMIEAGAKSPDITAVIGPCIRQQDFEVGPEFVNHFPGEFLIPGDSDRLLMDLPGFVTSQLLSNGLKKNNIIDSGLNTFPDQDRFHSYRRDGIKAGRMFAFLGWL